MPGKDSKVSHLLRTAAQIERDLYNEGFSPEEVLFIATILSQAASRAMNEVGDEDEDDDEDEGDYDEEAAKAPSDEDSEYA